MKRGTTYPLLITVNGIDLSAAEWVIVSIKPHSSVVWFAENTNQTVIELDRTQMSLSSDGTDTSIIISLTQAQSLSLAAGDIEIEANWMIDGIRGGTNKKNLEITDTLLQREVYADG